jgi:predicted oxidoreductase (fatty acid repression mutant protein)
MDQSKFDKIPTISAGHGADDEVMRLLHHMDILLPLLCMSIWSLVPVTGVQDTDTILRTINASIDAISRLKRPTAYNLSHAPPGLDAQDYESEQFQHQQAKCRNQQISRPDYIMWTSHESSHHLTRQNRLDLNEIPPPALLWAFPGSASPWLRLLIEYATGHLTGSVATDTTVTSILGGETHGCDRGVLLLHADALQNKIARLIDSPIKYICNKKISNLKSSFTRIVMVVRNPYDTLWECYMREMYEKHSLLPSGKLRKSATAVVESKFGMIRKLYFEQVHFRERMEVLASEWIEYLEAMETWEKKFPHTHLMVQIEQLFSTHNMGSEEASGQDVKKQVNNNYTTPLSLSYSTFLFPPIFLFLLFNICAN